MTCLRDNGYRLTVCRLIRQIPKDETTCMANDLPSLYTREAREQFRRHAVDIGMVRKSLPKRIQSVYHRSSAMSTEPTSRVAVSALWCASRHDSADPAVFLDTAFGTMVRLT